MFCIQQPSMLGKFLVHASRACGGLNEKHSILAC